MPYPDCLKPPCGISAAYPPWQLTHTVPASIRPAVDSATSAELADRAGIAERYAREWLEQQAVAGVLDVAADAGGASGRRYRLPDGAAEVLCEPENLYHLAPLAPFVVSVAQALPQVVEAFRSGGGVPYEDYPGVVDAIARVNRPMFANQLAAEWIPALPDIEARLRRTGARVADLGCGTGWSTLALARAYPAARVDGIDLDEESIEAARRKAAESGLGDRITFGCRDAADPGLAAAMAEPGSAGTGTVIRPETVRRYAREAGFGSVMVLPVEHDFWRFYRLDP